MLLPKLTSQLCYTMTKFVRVMFSENENKKEITKTKAD